MIKQGILELCAPENPLPVIVDSPHSGNQYPEDFHYTCDLKALKRLEDSYVDELFQNAPDHGAPLLRALFPRAYIDVNRKATDIDELLLSEPWPYGVIEPSRRAEAGIGLIPRLVKPALPIYGEKLSPETIMNRIKNYYEPYHDTLCTLLEKAYDDHGQIFHLNVHSMPSSSAYPKKAPLPAPSDIVLGDSDGYTCTHEFKTIIKAFWQNKGYRVTINDPFKGVELITRYAQPTRGRNSLQIEINRALYMNEDTGEKSKNFEKIKQDCTDMVKHACDYALENRRPVAAD